MTFKDRQTSTLLLRGFSELVSGEFDIQGRGMIRASVACVEQVHAAVRRHSRQSSRNTPCAVARDVALTSRMTAHTTNRLVPACHFTPPLQPIRRPRHTAGSVRIVAARSAVTMTYGKSAKQGTSADVLPRLRVGLMCNTMHERVQVWACLICASQVLLRVPLAGPFRDTVARDETPLLFFCRWRNRRASDTRLGRRRGAFAARSPLPHRVCRVRPSAGTAAGECRWI